MTTATTFRLAAPSHPHEPRRFRHAGYCQICGSAAVFSSTEPWFRDHLRCSGCGSIPRERALYKVIRSYFPDYRNISIHESSPGGRGASAKLRQECGQYTASHYYPQVPLGEINPESGYRCENLECLTYADASFDLFVTQDVMEHVYAPERAFREIARVLKPGGLHIFTVPLTAKTQPSERRAGLDAQGRLVHYREPQHHGNPIDAKGALVTMDWGYDITGFILESAGMPSVIFCLDDIDHGIRAEYIDVVVSQKARWTHDFRAEATPGESATDGSIRNTEESDENSQ